MNVDRLILTMVFDSSEENASTQETDLKRFDVNIDAKLVPGVGADEVRNNGREQSIHVKQEPEDEDTACYQFNEPCPTRYCQFVGLQMVRVNTYQLKACDDPSVWAVKPLKPAMQSVIALGCLTHLCIFPSIQVLEEAQSGTDRVPGPEP